ncbi:MAG: hypothetical protein K5876_05685 [Ruminiclostridium sp.]|nr:hypothetical protein [Ruminiclostridium sp.]
MNDDDIVQRIADVTDGAAESLFLALKYCYLVGEEDFYNINVKDIFRIGLSDITDPDRFRCLGLSLERGNIGEMAGESFARVQEIIRYSFAVRLPFARREAADSILKESQIKLAYEVLEEYGFSNPEGIVALTFKAAAWLAKTKKPEPQYDTEWFRSWVYTYGVELSAINNRNMLLLGCSDALFPLYYSALKEKLVSIMNGTENA